MKQETLEKMKSELGAVDYAISAYEDELNAIIAVGFQYFKNCYEQIREENHENIEDRQFFEDSVQYLADRIGAELADQTSKLFYEIGKNLRKSVELEERIKEQADKTEV